MIKLSPAEREKFSVWCKQEARSANEMAAVCAEKLDKTTADAITRKYRTEAAALMITSGYLSSIEEVTLRGD